MPVRSQRSSTATTTITAAMDAIVYSISPSPAEAGEDPADGLEGEQGADGDYDEEHKLLDGNVEGQLPTGDVVGVVGPVVAGDGDHVPQKEDGDGQRERRQQP